MKLPVLVLILLAVLIVPVYGAIVPTGGNIDLAQSIVQNQIAHFSYTANVDEKISIIEFQLPIGSQVNFTLYYGTGSTVSGLAYYRSQGIIGTSYSEVAIEDVVYDETFLDAQVAGIALTKHVQFTSYARNSSVNPPDAGFAIYAQGYGLYSSEIAYYPIADLQNNLIYRIDINVVGEPIDVKVDTARADMLQQYVATTAFEAASGGLTAAAIALWNDAISIKDIGLNILYWLRYIFWDHVVLTFALYFSVTMAVSFALTEGTIFKKMQKFFKYQVSILNFMIGSFNTVIQMLSAAVGFFKL